MSFRTSLLVAFTSLALLPCGFAQDTAARSAGVTTSTSTSRAERIAKHDGEMKRAMDTARFGMDRQFLEENIDREMAEAIADGDTPGGVVLVLRGDASAPGLIAPAFHKAYGNRSVAPTTETATLDTIYDLASLTKSIATATSIMKLMEQGKIRLTDPVSKYIPEWKNTPEEEQQADLLSKLRRAVSEGKIKRGAGMSVSQDNETRQLLAKAYKAFPDLQSSDRVSSDFNMLPRDRESITIRHLLTHTSGLPSFLRYYETYPEGHAHDKIVGDIAQVKLRGPVGGQFIYSDLGFIVLGDIVQRVSGLPLDEFSKKNVFEPLGMNDTGFNPPDDKISRVAPTEWRAEPGDNGATRTMIRGKVHDGNAFVQDGVSGHAGLFSTAEDVGIFCKMLLNNGFGAETQQRVLSPITIAAMTRNQARLADGEAQRGLGWDIESPYDGERGNLFSSGFGHTGFTGTSIWIVPEEKLAIVILSNRVHPDGKGDVVGLRSRIANIVAGSITVSYKNRTSESNQ